MKTALELLNNVKVASPCTADWNDMHGDDHVRYCGHCEKNVYNLSTLTSDAAIDLIREKVGNLCGRFYRRYDGTLLTADCPVGAHHRIKRKRRLAALAASLAGILSLNGCTRFDESTGTTTEKPPARQEKIFTPPPVEKDFIMGKICPPDCFPEPPAHESSGVLPPPREVRID